MALSTTTVNTQVSDTRYKDTAATNSLILLTATDSQVIHQVIIDNTANTTKAYLAVWNSNSTGGVTLGTTHPGLVLPVEAETSVEYAFEPGIPFPLGIVYLVSTEAGTPDSSPAALTTAITIDVLFA